MTATRTARTLLAAGTKGAALPTPHFLTGVVTVEEYLPQHGFLHLHPNKLVGPTKTEFVDALTGLRESVASGEVAIVMFGGHGDDGSVANRHEGWLFRDEIFDDTELAAALRDFPAGVEKVVITDCCYAAGMFTADTVANFAKRRVRNLLRAFELAGGNANADFLIIASAMKDEVVAVSLAANAFTATLCEELPERITYDVLGDHLRVASLHKSSHWIVDGRPQDELQKIALAIS